MTANEHTQFRLYKKEKLCSVIAIGKLFGPEKSDDTESALAYPLRMVWRSNPRRRSDAPVQFLISIPKKRLRHAVDRVLMRRRVREAYRLTRPEFPLPADVRLDVVFIYVANELTDYDRVQRSMAKLLARLQKEYNKDINHVN